MGGGCRLAGPIIHGVLLMETENMTWTISKVCRDAERVGFFLLFAIYNTCGMGAPSALNPLGLIAWKVLVALGVISVLIMVACWVVQGLRDRKEQP